MIAVDDLNDWVGFLGGQKQVITPAMDRLAKRSTVFDRAYCNVPVCAASRASALSGLSPQSTGVFDNLSAFKMKNPGKREFDEMLELAGYKVARFGKVDHTYKPVKQLTPPVPNANKLCYLPANDGAFDWGTAPGEEHEMPDFIYAQSGIDFLNEQPADKPFCLSVGFVRTHVGWWVPQRFFDMYPPASEIDLPYAPADDLNDIGAIGKAVALKYKNHECITKQNLWADAVRAYLASITWVDSQVGRLLDALEKSAHANNTYVVLWSDHGFHLGEKFHWHKLALWEHCTRVPFLIKKPNQTRRQTASQPVSLQDMAPTILDVCRVVSDYVQDGRSLKPLLDNPSLEWNHPVLTMMATATPDNGKHAYAVRDQNWRYIRYPGNELELYDETADKEEYTNLAYTAESRMRYADVIARLDALMPPATA